MNNQLKGSLFIMISATGSATLSIFTKYAFAAGANITTIVSVRFLLAALFLLLVLKSRHISPFINFKRMVQLCLMGAVGYGGMSILFANSLHYLPASLTGMLLYSYPAMVTLLSFLVGDEQFSTEKIIALFTCLAGLSLVLGVSSADAPLIGILSILSSAVIYSVYIVISNRILKSVNPLTATTYICASTGIVAFLYGLLDNSLIWQLPTQGWLAILGITIFPTLIGILFFFSGMDLIGPANASILCTLEPLVTVLLSIALLGETINYSQISGGLLIISGIIFLQLPALKIRKQKDLTL
jgi:drug/metabolite transporter (DMT)-like permease